MGKNRTKSVRTHSRWAIAAVTTRCCDLVWTGRMCTHALCLSIIDRGKHASDLCEHTGATWQVQVAGCPQAKGGGRRWQGCSVMYTSS